MMKKSLLLLFVLPLCLFADLNTTFSNAYDTIKSQSDALHKRATFEYHRFLYSMDCYLCNSDDFNRSSYEAVRKSRLLIVLSLKDNNQINLHLRGKVILPRTKNRLELLFSQDDKEELDNQRTVSQHDDVVQDKKLHVGLKYYLYRKRDSAAYGSLNFRLAPPLGPYLKLGHKKSYVSKKFLETSWDNALYYYLNGGKISASTALSFFKPLNNSYWIGQGNRLYWKGENQIFLSNSLLLYQIFDLNNRMVYKAELTTAYDRTHKMTQDGFSFSSGYFHRFNKWYFAELIPKFRKSRARHYDNELLLSLNFGMLLGK